MSYAEKLQQEAIRLVKIKMAFGIHREALAVLPVPFAEKEPGVCPAQQKDK